MEWLEGISSEGKGRVRSRSKLQASPLGSPPCRALSVLGQEKPAPLGSPAAWGPVILLPAPPSPPRSSSCLPCLNAGSEAEDALPYLLLPP